MIPITLQPAPLNFKAIVEDPGKIFLATTPNPTEAQWKKKALWREVLPYSAEVYGAMCAYCATKIWHSTSAATIDHCVAKSANPQLAYKWDNYRYVSSRFNGRKGIRVIADPFSMQGNWFEMKFPEMAIKPSSNLTQVDEALAKDTIEFLQLNSDRALVKERFDIYLSFMNNEISFSYLESLAPFLASELKRNNIQPFSK
jgi:hypothetical protein